MNITSRRIKEVREKNNITLREMARRLDISHSTLKRYEDGDTKKLDTERLASIATALNVSVPYLMGWTEEETRTIPKEEHKYNEITNIYKELTIPRKEKVVTYAKVQLEEQEHEIEQAIIYSYINLYGSISAGTGNYIFDNPVEQIRIKGKVPQHDIALKVNGDSMEPLFEDGEIVYIRKIPVLQDGQIGAFILNNEAYLKKFYNKNGQIRLVSLNKKYKDILLHDYEELHIIGKVVF